MGHETKNCNWINSCQICRGTNHTAFNCNFRQIPQQPTPFIPNPNIPNLNVPNPSIPNLNVPNPNIPNHDVPNLNVPNRGLPLPNNNQPIPGHLNMPGLHPRPYMQPPQ